ncbi:MAG TPA: 16S rRNA (guanine(966)-N(2))-methyltransferase RsmD [Gammaproteobacteria bacterium]|nr:16S rRNA (guanine(966)-N(2))-methyltransferase RsmD [Gammaproteobacteria bacterium]
MAARNNQVRIIAGRWRGRRLAFPEVGGLRPTADRIRETLFNWLTPRLPGASCLDLFAGSGALGFEAASRGAEAVVLVERDRLALAALEANRRRLDAPEVSIVGQSAERYLAGVPQPFDIVFLDPPFARPGLLDACAASLAGGGWLKAGARIYVELPAKGAAFEVPDGWRLDRRKRAGQVEYRLYVAPS